MNFLTGAPVASDEDLLELVERLYCTRYFRKRPAPSQILLDTLRRALADVSSPLNLFFLWGVHEKPHIAEDDHQALDYLAAFMEYISLRLSVKTQMTLVICDTHGAINRVDNGTIDEYAAQIESAVNTRGWEMLKMSRLWLNAGISLDTVNEKAKLVDIETDAPRLVQFAHRYYLGSDAENGARCYLAARLLEKPLLTQRFQGAIHVTPVEPSLHFLQPELPDFYVWIKKRGCSIKPWFSVEGN